MNPEEKQRNIRKITEDTEWDLDEEPQFLRTIEAEVNQFRQLCENDGKGTEKEMTLQFFSVFFVVDGHTINASSGARLQH